MAKKTTENKEETLSAIFEERISILGEKLTSRLVTWMRNDTIFDGFRNTPARIILNVLSYLVLYGGAIYCWSNFSGVLTWFGILLVLLLCQAISVRFVFQVQGVGILDEYHERRRARAYSRAYKSFVRYFAFIAGFLIVAFGFALNETLILQQIFSGFTSMVDNYRLIVLFLLVSGVVAFQKYFSYGVKGEPFLSRDEVKAMKNS